MAKRPITCEAQSSPFQALAQRLKAWRATRSPGARIPEELWKGAVDLARVHGLSPTVTALNVGYYELQRRLGGAGKPRRQGAPVTQFVEVSALPTSPGQPGTLELVQTSGARLTVRLPNAGAKDFLPIVHLFLRRG